MSIARLTLLPEPLKKAFLGWIDPLAAGLVRAGLTPNHITTISIILIVGSGALFAVGMLHWGGAMLLLSGLFDLLDGKVARSSGQASKFGAFYDSSMDRLGEGALFTGIAIYYMTSAIHRAGERMPVLALGLCFACLTGCFLVSYTRARAEGLGLEAKVGMAQRAERIVFLGAPTLFFGAGGWQGWMLLGILAWLTLISWITVIQRIAHVYRITADERQPATASRHVNASSSQATPPSGVPDPAVKGT